MSAAQHPAPLGVESVRVADMRTFVTLAQTRHFGQAARALGVSQPVVSSRIASIESQLGFAIIDRSARSFALTTEGRMILSSFREILSKLQELNGALRDAASDTPEIIRIGAIDTAVSSWLPELIDRLHIRFPGLRIALTIQGTQELLENVCAGTLDLVFGLAPAIGADIGTWAACEYEMSWVGAPSRIRRGHVHSVAELAQEQIIAFPPGTPPAALLAPYFQDEKALAANFISCNSLFAILALARRGDGIAAVPTVTVAQQLATGELVQLGVEKLLSSMPLIASWRTDRHKRLLGLISTETRREIASYCTREGTVWP